MSTLEIGLIVVVVLLAGAWLLNRQAVKDLFGAGRTALGDAGRAARNANPLGNYQQMIDDATGAVVKAKQGMQRAVALIKSVERQVTSGQQEKARLEARIQKAQADNDLAKARDYALQLATCEQHLSENEAQLKNHKEAYDGFVNDVKHQQEKITQYQREGESLGVRLEMSKANKEFNEFRQSFTTQNGALKGGLEAQREAVLRQIDQNNAAGQVDKDVGGGVTSHEEEDAEIDRQIKADEILKRFQKTT
jgi:phage shock protein A